jgi:hypothetical protein
MGWLDGLRQLLGGGAKPPADRGLYYYVRCDKCGETIRVRVDPHWDLAQDFDGDGGYGVTKHVVGQKCFRTIEVTFSFDQNRKEASKSIVGGQFVTAQDYDAEHVEK